MSMTFVFCHLFSLVFFCSEGILKMSWANCENQISNFQSVPKDNQNQNRQSQNKNQQNNIWETSRNVALILLFWL